MELHYDMPIQVTENQYRKIMSELKGVCAGRVDNGTYYIKLWLMSWKTNLIWIIETEK